MVRADWGKAKVEIYALRHKILSLYQHGQNLEEIYRELISDASFLIGKSTFKRHASAIIKTRHQSPDAASPAPHPDSGSPDIVTGSATGNCTAAPAAAPHSTPVSSFGHEAAADEETIRAFFEGDT